MLRFKAGWDTILNAENAECRRGMYPTEASEIRKFVALERPISGDLASPFNPIRAARVMLLDSNFSCNTGAIARSHIDDLVWPFISLENRGDPEPDWDRGYYDQSDDVESIEAYYRSLDEAIATESAPFAYS